MKTSVWALVVASMVLALFTSAALRQVGVPNLGFVEVLTVCAGWLTVVASGALTQKVLAIDVEDEELTFAVAAGIVLGSIVVLGLCELFQIPAASGVVVFGVLVSFALLWYRSHFNWTISGLGPDLIVLPCCAAFALVWSWGSLTSIGNLPTTGRISLWTDIFIHATTILQYGDFWSTGRGNLEFANSTRTLYHYGSYVLPAALFSTLDMSGLQAAVGLHLPIGLLAMFAGTHALAKQIAAPSLAKITGLLSMVLLCIAPDTSTYGLANGWFGVRWMLLSSPGSSYAIAGVLLSLIFLKRWLDDRGFVALVMAVAFAAMVFQLRAHMLLWYLPVLVTYLMLSNQRWMGWLKKNSRLVALALALTLTLTLTLLAALDFLSVRNYLWFVHVGNVPTGYSGLYQELLNVFGEPLGVSLGFLMLYPGMLGALVLVYPVLLYAESRVNKLHPLQWFPLVLAVVAGLIIIWAPASSNGDPFEFKHRAFVLLYVTTLIWTCDFAVKVVYRKLSPLMAAWAVVAPVVVCVLIAFYGQDQFLAADKPKFQWGKQYVDTVVSKDMIFVADFVRHHSRPGDVAIVMPIDTKARAADNATQFASMANVPLYLARFTMWPPSLARSRLVAAQAIVSQATIAQVNQMMRTHGLRWLVLTDSLAPAFDPDFSRAVFKKGEWTVYQFN